MAVKTPVVTAEYAEALRVLNDETMSQACALLLSERDYEEHDGKSDYEELLALYGKCRNAAAVIKREAPAELLSVPTMPAPARAQAKPLGKATVATKNMIPSRRMARLPPPAKGKRPLLHHEGSDSSMGASNTKKARISPPPPPREGSAPPPSALNFLAKLNKEKDKKEVKEEVKEKKEIAEKEAKEKEVKEKEEEKETVDNNAVKGRIQPPRASRR
jgi:hypothetical protein